VLFYKISYYGDSWLVRYYDMIKCKQRKYCVLKLMYLLIGKDIFPYVFNTKIINWEQDFCTP